MMRTMTEVRYPPTEGQTKAPAVRALFAWIKEPRVVRVMLLFAYLGYLAGGLVVLSSDIMSLEAALGHSFMIVLGLFLAIGGLFGAVAVLPGWWWLERAGVSGLIAGGAMYSVTVISLQVTATDNLNRGLQMVFVLGATLSFVIRYLNIRRADLDPKV